MTRSIRIAFCVFLATVNVYGQVTASIFRTYANDPARGELAAGYNHIQRYEDIGDCNCIMSGGFVSAALRVTHRGTIDFVGDFAMDYGSGMGTNNLDMTLLTYLAGVRLNLRGPQRKARIFAEGLFGGAHASGTLLTGIRGDVCSADATALKAGGGIDLRLSRRISWRLVDASYLRTDFNNGKYSYQGNLRLDTGVVLHFGFPHAKVVAQDSAQDRTPSHL